MAPITLEIEQHLAHLQIHRPEKRNAFTVEMFRLLGELYTQAEADPQVRCVLISAAGKDFTTGLDLMDVAPAWMEGQTPFEDDQIDPWGVAGVLRKKPLVLAIQGRCWTLGMELALAADIAVGTSDSTFALKEVTYGFYPAGGGIHRLIRAAGWGNAMRWVLTGDVMDANEAHRLGFLQEIVEPGQELQRAKELAERIASHAPLAVQGALARGQAFVAAGEAAASEGIIDAIRSLMNTEDAQEAVAAFFERRPPIFHGR